MKKALLIATTLITLSLPAHAAQINQADQGDQDNQAKMSQQAEKIQPTTSLVCRIINGRRYCF